MEMETEMLSYGTVCPVMPTTRTPSVEKYIRIQRTMPATITIFTVSEM